MECTVVDYHHKTVFKPRSAIRDTARVNRVKTVVIFTASYVWPAYFAIIYCLAETVGSPAHLKCWQSEMFERS